MVSGYSTSTNFPWVDGLSTGPRNLGRHRSNAYLLDLPNDMDISPVFNVDDCLPYRGTFEPSTLPSSVSAGEASKGAPTMPSL